MPELSIDNINLIISDVKKQEISFSHLADELIDHLCCDVEVENALWSRFYRSISPCKQKIRETQTERNTGRNSLCS